MVRKSLFNHLIYFITFLLLVTSAAAQKKDENARIDESKAVLWEQVDIPSRDLFYGPGGQEMQPDLSKITFIEEDKSGHNKKYRIKDGAGKVWVAKLGTEARPETAAVRLLWGLGYKTEVNYLVPKLTIPGKGTFENVRLEARPENIKRLDEWKWEDNPFFQTNQLQGLKIMMVFIKNYDLLDLQNKVLEVDNGNGKEYDYIISDLGATFGKLGNNNLPLIFRLGRSTGKPDHYIKSDLVRSVDEDGFIVLDYKGKNLQLMEDITVKNGEWIYGLLSQLTDKQIGDAFRAANYSPEDVQTYTIAVKEKIAELSDLSVGKQTDKKQ